MRRLLAPSALALSALALSALALGACAHLPPLTAALPEQAVATDPRSATAEVGGVRLTVRADKWRGWPSDLDDYVTPVEVIIENGSGKEISVRHTQFSLIVQGGFRYDALGANEVRRLIGSAYGGPGGYWYYGAFGVYPWPGLYMPWPHYYPYVWWGDPWWGDPWFGAPPPPPPRVTVTPTPNGKLIAGGKVSILVFFPIQAHRVTACTVEAQVVAADGATIGTAKLPFERREVAKAGGRTP